MRICLLILSALACATAAFAQVATNRPAATTLYTPYTAVKPAGTNRVARPRPANAYAAAPAKSVAANDYVLDNKYVLRSGDKVSFQIKEDRELPKSLVVTDSKELDFPYIGRVSVDGKTCRQVADMIKPLLEKDYYYVATIVLSLDSANVKRGKVSIFGAVRNPGQVDLLFGENLTVGQAILHVGGFTDFADKKHVRVTRNPNGPPDKQQTFIVNMVDVLDKGHSDKDIVLEPDDYVNVKESMVHFSN